MNTAPTTDKPQPPDDSYEVMHPCDIPKPCPKGLLLWGGESDPSWAMSSYRGEDSDHPDLPAHQNFWYAVPKSSLPAKEPEKPTPPPGYKLVTVEEIPLPVPEGTIGTSPMENGKWVVSQHCGAKTKDDLIRCAYYAIPDTPAADPAAKVGHQPAIACDPKTAQVDPLGVQIGGSHYKNFAIQPVEFITANKLSFLEGCVIKRVCRHRAKNGAEDIKKAIHELELLLKLEYRTTTQQLPEM